MPMGRFHNRQISKKLNNVIIHFHSVKGHSKVSKIGKFGCEVLQNMENICCQLQNGQFLNSCGIRK
jgi:hypothetical protein